MIFIFLLLLLLVVLIISGKLVFFVNFFVNLYDLIGLFVLGIIGKFVLIVVVWVLILFLNIFKCFKWGLINLIFFFV